MVEQIGSILEKSALMNMGIITSFFIPTDAIYRKMVFGLMSGPDNPIDVFSFNPFACRFPPSSLMVIYAVLYSIIFLIFALRKFNRRDI